MALSLAAVLALSACGQIKLGGSAIQENEPSGTIVEQKELTGQGGKTVSGAVVIYYQSAGQYVIRLSNVVLPSESGLQIIPVVNSQAQAPFSLRATSGSHNYSISFNALSVTWNQVRIYSTLTDQDYAVALF